MLTYNTRTYLLYLWKRNFITFQKHCQINLTLDQVNCAKKRQIPSLHTSALVAEKHPHAFCTRVKNLYGEQFPVYYRLLEHIFISHTGRFELKQETWTSNVSFRWRYMSALIGAQAPGEVFLFLWTSVFLFLWIFHVSRCYFCMVLSFRHRQIFLRGKVNDTNKCHTGRQVLDQRAPFQLRFNSIVF